MNTFSRNRRAQVKRKMREFKKRMAMVLHMDIARMRSVHSCSSWKRLRSPVRACVIEWSRVEYCGVGSLYSCSSLKRWCSPVLVCVYRMVTSRILWCWTILQLLFVEALVQPCSCVCLQNGHVQNTVVLDHFTAALHAGTFGALCSCVCYSGTHFLSRTCTHIHAHTHTRTPHTRTHEHMNT